MSFTLELQGNGIARWPLSNDSIDHLERIRKQAARSAVGVVLGDDLTRPGIGRTFPSELVAQAVGELISLARSVASGFQVRVPPTDWNPRESIGAGASVIIKGRPHVLMCWGEYWTLQTIDDARVRKEPVRRYESVDIACDNYGVVKVERKKPRDSKLVQVLRQMLEFLSNDGSETIVITWG